jgi:hypothetical protein
MPEVLYKSLGLNEMEVVAKLAGREHGPTRSSSLQGYPDENEESLLPRILGVWKVAIIR